MSSLFRFKQFSLNNEASAMKVGTDGVLLGAWADLDGASTILDVGAGTGLLSLMAAQRAPQARILGVEIDPVAAAEAEANVAASPWADRIAIRCADIATMDMQEGSVDLIISNPPFFDSALRSPEATRATARHEGSLSFDSLLSMASKVLSPCGSIAMIAPADRLDGIEWLLALNRLSLWRRCAVSTVPGKPPRRHLWQAGRIDRPAELTALTINTAPGIPTPEYRRLTGDFYLAF